MWTKHSEENRTLAVYRYTGTVTYKDDCVERGTVVADTKEDAMEKLRKYRVETLKLQKVPGQAAFFMGFTASIK
jgi:type II secretory pathway component PulF